MEPKANPESASNTAAPTPFLVLVPCPACAVLRAEGAEKPADPPCPQCQGTGVGKYLHGTKADLQVGELIVAGKPANFGDRERISRHVYFTGTLDAAAWGAELAVGEGPGRIYAVEPTGPFEDDPNLTNKRFPGNPTRSFRSQAALRVTEELTGWVGHPVDQVRAMREGLDRLAAQGLATIDD